MLRQKNENTSIFRSLDWPVIVIYLIMVLAGVVSIYSASYDFDHASLFSFEEFSGKQIRWILMAFGLALALLLIETRLYETYAYPVYILMVILLAVTPIFAPDIKGSRSWLVMGPMSLQPAEFAQVATSLALARLFASYNFTLNSGALNYVKACAIILVPFVLIILQKETGSALVFLSLFFVLYREGMTGLLLFGAALAVFTFVVSVSWADTTIMGMTAGQFYVLITVMLIMVVMLVIYGKRRMEVARNVLFFFLASGLVLWILCEFTPVEVNGTPVLLSIIGVSCVYVSIEVLRSRIMAFFIPVATVFFAIVLLFSVNIAFGHLKDYQQKRILVAFGIVDDPRGVGYNVNQAKIAIGSGGIAGKGFLEGTQTKLKYVPEQHTDFILCTIGEEQGFWGTMLVELLFVTLILRIIAIAERQPTVFGRVYAYCVASIFICHFCINIGMVLGLLPVIGIPLPFFSYGGSSLWGFTILLFILLRIDASRKSVLSY